MLEYDYVLVRDEGDEQITYRPKNISTTLDNVVCIEGPNSSGKSTLLNILALGFYGLEKGKVNPQDKINPALRNKMDYLINSDHQQLKFNIKITNKDESLMLLSEKNEYDNKIKVYEMENGSKKLLTSESFLRKYNIIYDIPDNPTERLYQLIYDIRSKQEDNGRRIGVFRNYILKTIEDIRNSKDPDTINKLKLQLFKVQEEFTNINKEIEFAKNDLNLLEKYTYSKYLIFYNSEFSRLNDELFHVKDNQLQKQKTFRKINKDQRKLEVELRQLQEIYLKVSTHLKKIVPKSEAPHLLIWERISFSNPLKD